jgi:hypothetical protein
MSRADTFIHSVTSSKTYHPDGTVDTAKDPAVWTLAHRGYSGGGRLDVWVYPTKAVALREGAALAMACGMDEDAEATALLAAGKFTKVMERYEQTHPETHLLRVLAAFLHFDD